MVWPWFFCRTVSVCPQSPYGSNDIIIWIFPDVLCLAFCMQHWPMWKKIGYKFHPRSSTSAFRESWVWMISRSPDYFITCYTVLTRPSKVETGCPRLHAIIGFRVGRYHVALHHCFLVFLFLAEILYFLIVLIFTVSKALLKSKKRFLLSYTNNGLGWRNDVTK